MWHTMDRKAIKALDEQIENLRGSVASIREQINATSPAGNVFKEIAPLTNQHKLTSSDQELVKARETARDLQLQVDPLKSAGFLKTIFPSFGPPTKQRLSSKLEGVIEQIRLARMAANFSEYYQDFKSNENNSRPTTTPDNLNQAIGFSQNFATTKQDFEQQYEKLQDFLKSRDPKQPPGKEDEQFSALAEFVLEAIGTLKRHIEELPTIGLDAEIRTFTGLETEIKRLNESVASIRNEINETSPVGNVFHEIENLRDDRKDQLRAFERKLQGARQTAKELLKRVNSLPERTGALLGEISPGSDPQTKQRLSSDLQAVVEKIRRATMAAVYPAKYRDIQGSETIRTLPTTFPSNRFEEPGNTIRILEPELQDLTMQYAELRGFVRSKDPGQPPAEEDQYFFALTERIAPLIEILQGHIEELQRPQREGRPQETQSEPNLPAANQAQVLRSRAHSEDAIGLPVVWRH